MTPRAASTSTHVAPESTGPPRAAEGEGRTCATMLRVPPLTVHVSLATRPVPVLSKATANRRTPARRSRMPETYGLPKVPSPLTLGLPERWYRTSRAMSACSLCE